MNYFFGLISSKFKSILTIPKFQNNTKRNFDLYPCEAFVDNNKWVYKKTEFVENKNFFFVKNNVISNDKIFFLSNLEEISAKNIYKNKLCKLNNFTETFPVNFRSNLRILFNNEGFSSYQSEYPLNMIQKNGNILSPIYPLLNTDADENYIFFRNIFELPIKKKFKVYLVDLVNKKILSIQEIYTNFSNLLKINKEFIRKNVYFFSENFLGIPIFISVNENHVSMEHTHPPHHYILSEDRYKTISRLKEEIKNIILN